MDALREQERCASVPEVVEADVGETGLLEERRKGTLSEIGGVDRGPGLACEDQALIVVEVSQVFVLLPPRRVDAAYQTPLLSVLQADCLEHLHVSSGNLGQ